MTDPAATKASGDVAAWANGQTIEGLIRRSQADPALHQMVDELLPDTIADLPASEVEYRREFAAPYGPRLEAMSEEHFVSAAPGPHFGPED